jgi:hypothetical protein
MMTHPHDPIPDSASPIKRTAIPEEAATVDIAYRLLLVRGFSSVEAGNLAAYMAGLHPAELGWTVDEIKQLIVIRSLVAAGVNFS